MSIENYDGLFASDVTFVTSVTCTSVTSVTYGLFPRQNLYTHCLLMYLYTNILI